MIKPQRRDVSHDSSWEHKTHFRQARIENLPGILHVSLLVSLVGLVQWSRAVRCMVASEAYELKSTDNSTVATIATRFRPPSSADPRDRQFRWTSTKSWLECFTPMPFMSSGYPIHSTAIHPSTCRQDCASHGAISAVSSQICAGRPELIPFPSDPCKAEPIPHAECAADTTLAESGSDGRQHDANEASAESEDGGGSGSECVGGYAAEGCAAWGGGGWVYGWKGGEDLGAAGGGGGGEQQVPESTEEGGGGHVDWEAGRAGGWLGEDVESQG